jgi:hypothetical protein
MAEGHIAPFPTYEPELLGQRVVVIGGSAAIGFEIARPARFSWASQSESEPPRG